MEVTLKIFRYNPEKDKKPAYKTYKLEAIEMDRVPLRFVWSFKRADVHRLLPISPASE